MSNNETQGFDVVYEISTARFQNVLRNLFIDDLPLALGRVDLTYPLPGGAGANQTGYAIFGRPTPAFALDADEGNNAFRLTLTFAGVRLSLDPVAPIGLTFPGLAGLPLSGNSSAVVRMQLGINTMTSGPSSPITITATSVTMTDLDPLPDGIAIPSTATQAQMAAAIQMELKARVVGTLESIFPFQIPITLPTSGPCDIRPRQMQMRFLPGNDGRADALGFMLRLRDGSRGDLNGFTVSRVENSTEGVLMVANSLLRDLVCCVLPDAAGLPEVSEVADQCCRWTNLKNVNIGGTTFPVVPLLEVCIDNGIRFSGDIVQRGTGWWMRAHFDTAIMLRNEGGTLMPVADPPTITHDEGLECWVWIVIAIAAIVLTVVGILVGALALTGGFAGGVVGGVTGALIAIIPAAVVMLALYGIAALAESVIGPAVSALGSGFQALQLIPTEVREVFGSLELVGNPIIDDVRVRGRVLVPDWRAPRAQSEDQPLRFGESLDLDRGIVFTGGTNGGDPDVVLGLDTPPTLIAAFAPGDFATAHVPRALRTHGSARMAVLEDSSFFALREDDLRQLTYPLGRTSTEISAFPVSARGAPDEPLVFAVRTTEGRYAKCASWTDAAGGLHIRYRTYDTPVPLAMSAQWQTRRGQPVASDLPVVPRYEVSHRGEFHADPRHPLVAPVTYEWRWNGSLLSGIGSIDGATFGTVWSHCTLVSTMGERLRGELCVTATDVSGLAVTVCRDIDRAGTAADRLSASLDAPPQPPPPDPGSPFVGPPSNVLPVGLATQLARGIARGMDMPEERVSLR